MLNLLLAVLAAYRVARMLAMEEGPLSLFQRVRDRFDPAQATWLGRGLNCPLCMGFWLSGLIAACLLDWSTWQTLLLHWGGIAGGMTLLHLWIERAS